MHATAINVRNTNMEGDPLLGKSGRAVSINRLNSTVDTVVGRRRYFDDLSWKERFFLVVSLFSLIVSLGLTIERLIDVEKDKPDFTFALAVLVSILFCFYYVLSGILFERPYELGIFVLATFGLQVYIIINLVMGTRTALKWVRFGISVATTPLIILIGGSLVVKYLQSGKLIFRTVGATRDLQAACGNMFLFFGALKLDLQIAITMVILTMTDGVDLNLEDVIVLTTIGPITFISSILGYLSIRLEKKVLCFAYLFAVLVTTGYDIYMIVESADILDKKRITPGKESLVWVTMAAAAVSLIIRPVIFFIGGKAVKNFNIGLKQKVWKKDLCCSSGRA